MDLRQYIRDIPDFPVEGILFRDITPLMQEPEAFGEGRLFAMDLRQYIRDIPDFPVEGILFRDITPLMQEPEAFGYVIDRMAEHYEGQGVDVILGIEARGFLIGAPLAYKLGKPFVPVRKEGRLPYETRSVKYALEYGQNVVEVHTDAISEGQRAIILDDLLATGGTMAAGAELVESMGGEVAGLAAVIELIDLDGRERLSGYGVFSLVQY
jgi:adenine phosphoribosyltransferase